MQMLISGENFNVSDENKNKKLQSGFLIQGRNVFLKITLF
jgi:hypothetical protein